MRLAILCALVGLMASSGCMDKGLTVETAPGDGGDTAVDGMASDGNGSALDVADIAGPEDAVELAGDLAGKDDVAVDLQPEAAGPDIAAGPTCYEGLKCLLDMKTWIPGKPIPQGGCLEGISDGEMTQVDDLLGCVDSKCTAEFEAFDKGGATELSMLYLCIIEKCSLPASVCIGGQGDKDCGDALYCMAACPPLDQGCTVPCLAATSEAQSQKTGKFLDCVFQSCTLSQLPACIPNACLLKCPELAG